MTHDEICRRYAELRARIEPCETIAKLAVLVGMVVWVVMGW